MSIVQEKIIEAEAYTSIDSFDSILIEGTKTKEMFYKVAKDYQAEEDFELDLTAGDIIKV